MEKIEGVNLVQSFYLFSPEVFITQRTGVDLSIFQRDLSSDA